MWTRFGAHFLVAFFVPKRDGLARWLQVQQSWFQIAQVIAHVRRKRRNGNFIYLQLRPAASIVVFGALLCCFVVPLFRVVCGRLCCGFCGSLTSRCSDVVLLLLLLRSCVLCCYSVVSLSRAGCVLLWCYLCAAVLCVLCVLH